MTEAGQLACQPIAVAGLHYDTADRVAGEKVNQGVAAKLALEQGMAVDIVSH